jgi:predicted secreted protein
MSWATVAAIYFLIWWIVLFAVLPWGVRSQEESGDVSAGTDPGAPTVPRLMMKVVWTTIVATVLFAMFYANYVYRIITIEDLATLFGMARGPGR